MWVTGALSLLGACSDDGGRGGGGGSGVQGAAGPYFETAMFFKLDVTGVDKAANSDAIIASLRADGGWGNGDTMQIDFSFDVLGADATTPMMSFEPKTDEFYDPDCDNVELPVPRGGNVEGEQGYSCDGDGDCHLLVFDKAAGSLFEMWRATIEGGTFRGGCLAVWNTRMTYGEELRGLQCTSADAAGFPISPMLFTADEVAAGTIDHAIRLILPNDRITQSFVPPATHGTNTTGGSTAPSYGFHLRLKPSFDLASLPNDGARVVARAMQKYGMYHSDGGNIALTAQSDRYTTATWEGLLEPRDLDVLTVEDFEVIDHGDPIPVTQQCAR